MVPDRFRDKVSGISYDRQWQTIRGLPFIDVYCVRQKPHGTNSAYEGWPVRRNAFIGGAIGGLLPARSSSVIGGFIDYTEPDYARAEL